MEVPLCLSLNINTTSSAVYCKNTQKNCTKKNLHNPVNHNGVITYLEPDILECEVKWTLGSITTNKASGGHGIPVELL